MLHRWGSRTVGLILVCLALGAHFWVPSAPQHSGWLSRVNALWYDLRFQLLPPVRAPIMPVVIIDIDEFTQLREGRWPWDRSKIAALINALREQGAALIGFDMVFSEAGHNAAKAVLQQMRDSALISSDSTADAVADSGQLLAQLDALVPVLDGDTVLAEQLAGDTVLGFFFHNDGFNAGELPPAPILTTADEGPTGLIKMENYTANREVFNHSFPPSGFVVTVPDGDGIVRRLPLVMRHDDGIFNGLSLELARLALNAPWVRLHTESSTHGEVLTGIQLGKSLRIPVDPQGQMLVPYRGRAGSFSTISATRILHGDADEQSLESLKGAIVLIGTSALGLADLRTTPLQTSFPGVEVHANAVDTILNAYWQQNNSEQDSKQNPFYYQPDWGEGAVIAQILFFGLLLAVWLPGRSLWQMLLGSVGGVGLAVSLNLLLWSLGHYALPLALVVLCLLSIGAFNLVIGYWSTARQRQQIQNLFGEYVPAAHVAHMIANPTSVHLEGTQKEMTVLFADIRNFTAISEGLSPAELKSVLNRYLSAITEVIFAHQGTIDKYVGDLVMAFWNAPLDDAQHALHAVQTALAMQIRAQQLRAEFREQGLPEFHVGIGLNTGTMNVGDMGSVYRRAYTVLGDSVNLAARLESLCSYYGVSILVSDTTRAATPDIIYRTIDWVRVKGRQAPLIISQPIALNNQLSSNEQQTLKLHEQACQAYQEGELQKAQTLFNQLKQDLPADPLYDLYLQRIQAAHADTWNPVFTHDNK